MAGSKIGRYFEIENWPLFRLKRAGHAVSIFRFDFLKKISQKKNLPTGVANLHRDRKFFFRLLKPKFWRRSYSQHLCRI